MKTYIILSMILAGALLCGTAQFVYADSQTRTNAASVVSAPETPWDDVPWQNMSSVTASDDSWSTCNPDLDGNDSEVLVATDYGFSLPDGAAITGIVVRFERYVNTGESITDGLIELRGGSGTSDNKSAAASWNVGSDTTVTFGAPGNTWGLSWTKAQINSANFGVGVACTGGGNGAQAYVDFLELTVYYSPPGDETNRFHGATYDGYDQMSYLQTSGTNSYPLILARFNGGTHDGYDLNSFTNTPVVVQAESGGTIFGFR